MNIATTNGAVPAAVERIIAEKGMKKCAVAERAGITAQAFNDMLNGRRIIRVSDLVTLAKALGVAPGELLTDTRTA